MFDSLAVAPSGKTGATVATCGEFAILMTGYNGDGTGYSKDIYKVTILTPQYICNDIIPPSNQFEFKSRLWTRLVTSGPKPLPRDNARTVCIENVVFLSG